MSRSVYNWTWLRGRTLWAFWFSSGVQTFLGVRSFSGILWNLWKSEGSVVTAWGLAVDQSLGGGKNCTVYSLVCIVIIIIGIIITVVNIIITDSVSCVASQKCLYLNPWVFPFVHSSFPSHCGGRGPVSEWLCGVLLPATGLKCDTLLEDDSDICFPPVLRHLSKTPWSFKD